MRPAHVLLTHFISRSSCLCTKHQNMVLLLKSLKRKGVSVYDNPEVFVKASDRNDDTLTQKLPENVSFGQWKRVEVVEKERKKMVMRIVDTEVTKEAFIDMFKKQKTEFTEHVARVKEQYEQIRTLKKELPRDHAILQMDFAENYTCKSMDEIQSAYWNKTSVTLHPIVVYFRDRDDLLTHRSFVVVCDEMSHSCATVHAILDKIIPEVKVCVPNLKYVHYWTDGPTSQYRNKQIFHTVANNMTIFGVGGRWNYFEVGHGKGPCDGLGGTTKRMADAAVDSGKNSIQDAQQFYQWALSSTMHGVKFLFLSTQECQEAISQLEKRPLKPLKGTFKLHAVAGLGNSMIAVRDTSCYCKVCLEGGVCQTWSHESMGLKLLSRVSSTQAAAASDQPEGEQQQHIYPEVVVTAPDVEQQQDLDVDIGDFVAAVYQDNWYVGKVHEVDDGDGEIEVSFMEHKKRLLQWPHREDIIWIPQRDVLLKVDEPAPTGKSQRMRKLSEHDLEMVLQMYQNR